MNTAVKARKQFLLDAEKIKFVREITGSKTDTEAVTTALDMVISSNRIDKTLSSIRGKAKIKDIYGRTSR